MFKLYKKSIGPKVYWINYEEKKSDNAFHTIVTGYSLEEVEQEINDRTPGGIRIKQHLEKDLEELLNRYSEEGVALKQIKK